VLELLSMLRRRAKAPLPEQNNPHKLKLLSTDFPSGSSFNSTWSISDPWELARVWVNIYIASNANLLSLSYRKTSASWNKLSHPTCYSSTTKPRQLRVQRCHRAHYAQTLRLLPKTIFLSRCQSRHRRPHRARLHSAHSPPPLPLSLQRITSTPNNRKRIQGMGS
jgi:hypothetical protein